MFDLFFVHKETPNMNVKYCSVTGCCNSTMLGRKRKLFFEIPKTEPLNRIWAKSDREHNRTLVRYFCEDHFDPDDIQDDGDLKIFAAPVCNIPDVKSNHLVYSNRRKSERVQSERQRVSTMTGKRIKLESCETPPHTLPMVEGDGHVDNTVLNFVFHNFDNEEFPDHNGDEDINVHSSEYCANQDEDNDCVITDDIQPTIIDLSLDETRNILEESNKMIEIIMCNDIEPEESRENDFDIESCNIASESQPSSLVNSTIDLTIEEGSAIIEIIGRDELISHTPTIDLTEELCSDEDDAIVKGNVDTSTAIIEKIKQNLIDKHPKSLKSIQENRENGVLEIEISKDASFKSDEDFQQHLMKVVQLVQKSKREGEVVSEFMECEQNTPAEISRNKECAFAIKKIKVVPLKRIPPPLNRKGPRILNKHSSMKTNVPAKAAVRKEISESLPVICVDSENSEDNSDVQDAFVSNVQSSQFFGKIREYNANQILKRTNFYMGVSTESLQLVESMVSDDFQIKYGLILLLRKIKQNESFSTLSDILCCNRKYCRGLYETLLPKLSNTMCFLIQWPTNCRVSRAIADIFEIEIQKPKNIVQQKVLEEQFFV